MLHIMYYKYINMLYIKKWERKGEGEEREGEGVWEEKEREEEIPSLRTKCPPQLAEAEPGIEKGPCLVLSHELQRPTTRSILGCLHSLHMEYWPELEWGAEPELKPNFFNKRCRPSSVLIAMPSDCIVHPYIFKISVHHQLFPSPERLKPLRVPTTFSKMWKYCFAFSTSDTIILRRFKLMEPLCCLTSFLVKKSKTLSLFMSHYFLLSSCDIKKVLVWSKMS